MTQESRAAKLMALSEAHDDWVTANVAASPFDPPTDGRTTDYQEHHLDVSATAEQEADLQHRVKQVSGDG